MNLFNGSIPNPWEQVTFQLPQYSSSMAFAPLGGLLAVPLQSNGLEGVPGVASCIELLQLAGLHRVYAFGLLQFGSVTG